MKRFAALYRALDEATATGDKLEALTAYFRVADPADAAWALHLLMGNRPRRVVSLPRVREWAAEAAGIPLWLMEESYQHVGDLAETVALLTDPGGTELPVQLPLHAWIETRLLSLRTMEPAGQRAAILETWRLLDRQERFVWNKLLTGAFRVGVAGGLVIRAVAQVAAVPEEVITHRLMGGWLPSAAAWGALVSPDATDTVDSRPYPFALATALDAEPSTLGAIEEWIAEWKWDGIRAQLVRRQGGTWLWSRGDELLAGRFPELEEAALLIPPGTVLDGEILAWKSSDARPLPFSALQRRIQRQMVSRSILADAPVRFLAYDLLEEEGRDLRSLPFSERRGRLASIVERPGGSFRLSPIVLAPSWAALAELQQTAREQGAEGLMLKRASGIYQMGRKKGGWWKWKLAPLTVDAVLTAAQGGSGRRAGLYTDYTFGVWDGDTLVPFAKAYSGLTDEEIDRVDRFVRSHITERFGPVRMVSPELVFEIAFEGIQKSSRHKSGVAVRFPRIARWRTDKRPEEADTIETVRALIDVAR